MGAEVMEQRLHHGWLMLLACPLLTMASASGHSFALAPFIDGWMAEFHISRPTVSSFWTVAMIASAALAPCIGSIIDRLGTRLVLTVAIPLAIGTLVLLSMASGSIVLLVGITINRVVSADTLPLCSQIALNQWFVRYRGRASVMLGVATAELLLFPGVELRLLAWTGARRITYYYIAAYVGVLGTISAVLWRNSPESMGLLPDLSAYEAMPKGSNGNDQQKNAASASKDVEMTRGEASCTIIFWAIVLSTVNNSVLWVGCHFHLLDLLKAKGLAASAASGFYVAVSAARLFVSVFLGMCCLDRLQRKTYLLYAVQAVPQIVVVMLLLGLLGPDVWPNWMVGVFGLVYGVWGGIFTAVGNVVFAQLFGRAHLGSISGLAKGCTLLAGAIGPEFMALVHHWTHSYDLALKILLVSTIVSVVLLVCAPLPGSQLGNEISPEDITEEQVQESLQSETMASIIGQQSDFASAGVGHSDEHALGINPQQHENELTTSDSRQPAF